MSDIYWFIFGIGVGLTLAVVIGFISTRREQR